MEEGCEAGPLNVGQLGDSSIRVAITERGFRGRMVSALALACLGCHDKCHRPGGLQRFIFSLFWRPEVQGQGSGQFGFWCELTSGLQTPLRSPVAQPLRTQDRERELSSGSYEDADPAGLTPPYDVTKTSVLPEGSVFKHSPIGG